MKIFGRMLLGCLFAYEDIWLNVNLDAFLLLEISGGMLLRCFFCLEKYLVKCYLDAFVCVFLYSKYLS